MTDHIATIRKALDWAANWLGMKFTSYHTEAASALNALTAELQRLRDDPNRLDPQSVPEGWTIEVVDVCLSQTIDGRKRWVDGEGPNPRAALAAAIKWIGK